MIQPACAKKNQKSGFVLLYVVIILAAVVSAISIYSSKLAAFSVRSAIEEKKIGQAGYLADTCGEIAMQALWNDKNFTGSGGLDPLFGGSCTYQVISLDAQTGEVRVTGSAGNINRKTKILIDKSGFNFSKTSWSEVADF